MDTITYRGPLLCVLLAQWVAELHSIARSAGNLRLESAVAELSSLQKLLLYLKMPISMSFGEINISLCYSSQVLNEAIGFRINGEVIIGCLFD